MTAHVRILAERKRDIVRIPNAALRFKPADADDAPKQRKRAAPRSQAGQQPAGFGGRVRTGHHRTTFHRGTRPW